MGRDGSNRLDNEKGSHATRWMTKMKGAFENENLYKAQKAAGIYEKPFLQFPQSDKSRFRLDCFPVRTNLLKNLIRART